MFLLTDGEVEVDLETGERLSRLRVDARAPIGEIGYLRGVGATATVVAISPSVALVIDDAALARIETERPPLAAELLHYLAATAAERTSFNLTIAPHAASYSEAESIDVLLCRNQEMLESAQRLRYEVYCEELGRNSPYADHHRRIISDDLDRFGNTFVAIEAGQTIGTLRSNLCREGPVGYLEDLYGMRQSAHHPSATAVCTKFIVRKQKRGSAAAIKLIAAMVGFGLRGNIKECFIDCIPALIPYYRALGFRAAGPEFFHRENGPSIPMRLDLIKHGARLARDNGAREYMKMYVRAQAFRLADRVRGYGRQSAYPGVHPAR